jgi:tRNA(Arg) A34 adenosine deaminase TadA
MKIKEAFRLAAIEACKRSDHRAFLIGAVAIRKDGTLVKSHNLPAFDWDRNVHAEYRLSKKLDMGAEVFVARIGKDGLGFKNAKPCDSCLKILISKRVSRIYYTISNFEWGVIDLR